MKRFLKTELVQIVLLALPFAAAAVWWNSTPSTVAVHWNLRGQPDGFLPRAPGLLIVPLANIGLCLLFAGISRIDPRLRRDPVARTASFRRTVRRWRQTVTALLALLGTAMILIAAGWRVDIGRLACQGLLATLAVIGNALGNLPPNYLMGIRTPWTLENAATWRATHRAGGRLLLFGALGLLAASFFLSTITLLTAAAGFVAFLTGWSLWYSARSYRRQSGAFPGGVA